MVSKHLHTTLLRLAFIFGLWAIVYGLNAQQSQIYKPSVNRVLFVLDISGSMKEQWNGKDKYTTAKQLLYKLIDSVERKNPNVEFAIRAFGFQSPRSERNCKDSRLLVPFAKNNAAKIQAALDKISPQGMTPIAYSLQQAAGDFPVDDKSLNSIILITDGNENCDANPCQASKQLSEKRISLRPFIVGLGAGQEFLDKLKCVGTVLDTKDEASLYNTVGVIIRQTLNTTTAQVNLLDAKGEPTVTNVPFTLYDHGTRKILYNFVHTMNDKGNPDTLFLDPVGIYDIEVHTFPSVKRSEIELTAGKHNIIAVDVPSGDLQVNCFGASSATNDAQVVVRGKTSPKEILNVQNLNEQVKYLATDYQMLVLTTPEAVLDTTVIAMGETYGNVPGFGSVSISTIDKLQVSIYHDVKGTLNMVEKFELNAKAETHKLQPGAYVIVYKQKSSYNSESTKSQRFIIEEGRTAVLTL